MKVVFNRALYAGNEEAYIKSALTTGDTSGDNKFTKECHRMLQDRYGFKKVFLTTSCTDALEMSALLLNIQPGDQVIMPSYTFVSTANAFVLRGAEIIFADSEKSNPNIDPDQIEALITHKTKAIVIVHYAGVSCDMEKLWAISKKYNLPIVEDAAQCIDSYYKDIPLGRVGDLAAFSFHATKNITSGEGGALVVSNEDYIKRAEIVREKGTNRSSFFRGEVNKYGWVDIGSSFLMSDINAAVLQAQLEKIESYQTRRMELWQRYFDGLKPLHDAGHFTIMQVPDYARHNGHMFYIVFKSLEDRNKYIAHMKGLEVSIVFHYLSLHSSEYYAPKYNGKPLPESDRYSDCLARLPMHGHLTNEDVDFVIDSSIAFFNAK